MPREPAVLYLRSLSPFQLGKRLSNPSPLSCINPGGARPGKSEPIRPLILWETLSNSMFEGAGALPSSSPPPPPAVPQLRPSRQNIGRLSRVISKDLSQPERRQGQLAQRKEDLGVQTPHRLPLLAPPQAWDVAHPSPPPGLEPGTAGR